MDNNIAAAATTIAFGLFRLQKKVRIFFARPSKLPKPTVITCKMAQQQAEVVAKWSDNVVLPFSIIASYCSKCWQER